MSITVDEVKANLNGLLHGGRVDDLTEPELMLQRSANTLLSKIDPIDTMRVAALAQTVHDSLNTYSLPTDYKKIVDIIPQDNRDIWDSAYRTMAGKFDLEKAIKNKVISIEGSEGSKIIKINWKSRQGKVLHTMNSTTDNGTWSAVGSATNVEADSIFKVSGSASIKFTHVVTGDGIQNTTMTQLDLTDEDGVADVIFQVYFETVPTSVTAIWGNDLTTKYWTGVAQTTQADGTAFRVGWNTLKFSWETATQTGTVTPSTIDSFKVTLAGTALGTIRIDNIIFSIGRAFDIKYYSKYLLKNSSGTWIPKTTDDADICVLDTDAIQLYNLENLIAAAQQSQNNSADIDWAKRELNGNSASPDPEERVGLYAKYRGEYPTQSKKTVTSYGGKPRFNRGLRR